MEDRPNLEESPKSSLALKSTPPPIMTLPLTLAPPKPAPTETQLDILPVDGEKVAHSHVPAVSLNFIW